MLTIDKHADDAIINLLLENVVGTPGVSMIYQHSNIQNKLSHIDKAFFASIRKGNKVIGTICFVCRKSNGQDCFYIRFFSFKNVYRRNINKDRSSKMIERRGVKHKFDPLLEGIFFENYNKEQNIIYSYIDPNNVRSMEMAKGFGFQMTRTFSTLLFSRISPKKCNNVRRMLVEEKEQVRMLLMLEYEDYNFLTLDNLFMEDNYFVLEEEGEIVAGLQVHPELWKILELPGFSGKIMLNVISRLPLLRRIFNSNYRFLSVDGIFCKKGYEYKIQELLEGGLNIMGYNTAMLPVDSDSSLMEKISSVNFGLLNRLHHPAEIAVVCKFNGFSEEEINSYYNKPVYISGFDIS